MHLQKSPTSTSLHCPSALMCYAMIGQVLPLLVVYIATYNECVAVWHIYIYIYIVKHVRCVLNEILL